MKKIIFIIISIIMLSVELYAQNVILVDFKYKNVVIEYKELPNGKIEKTIKDYGFSDLNLQLRDLLIYKLNEKNYNAITDSDKKHDIEIKIHPVYGSGGNYSRYSILIEIFENDNILIAKYLIRGQSSIADLPEDVSNKIMEFIIKTLKK